MQIQITYGELESSDALNNHINEQVDHAMRHHKDHFTRVEVHLHDDNGANRGGSDDKRCVIEARPSGYDPIAVETQGGDVYKTVTSAAKKLERAARHFVERHRTR